MKKYLDPGNYLKAEINEAVIVTMKIRNGELKDFFKKLFFDNYTCRGCKNSLSIVIKETPKLLGKIGVAYCADCSPELNAIKK